jgi:hypothetical protein
MGHRRLVGGLVAGLLLLGACSDPSSNQTVSAPQGSTPETTEAPEPTPVLYVQHALFGTTTTDETGTTLTLSGVDQVTSWVADDEGGVLTTTDFIGSWTDLGLDAEPPQAALVPADPTLSPVALELSSPAWNAESRIVTYRVRPVSRPRPRLAGMDADPDAAIPETDTAASLLIDQPDAPGMPRPAVTTTTTTTTLPPDTPAPDTAVEPAPPASTQPPTSGSSRSNPAPPIAPPAPPSPPSGPPQFSASPSTLLFPAGGGRAQLTLINAGSGVGSWSVSPEVGVGLSASPVGGYLFPGSSVTISVFYNGSGPAGDFSSRIEVKTSSGVFEIIARVG